MVQKQEVVSFIDVFAGCGGFSLGAIQAGLSPILAVETDQNASETYRKNIANCVHTGDIRDFDSAHVPKCDLLIGGFPCQPFSLAGLQRGFEGKDGDLFNHCLRFLQASEAKAFIFENVPGFLRLQKGYWMAKAVEALQKLGYSVRYEVINAAEFGLPQKRERLFIVGNRFGLEFEFPKPSHQRKTVEQAIGDLLHFTDPSINHDPMRHSDRIKNRFAAVLPGESAREAMDRDPTLGTAKITKQCYRRLFANKPAPTVVANFVTTTIHYELDRNITAREGARLQGFPDEFIFCGFKTRMSWQHGLSQFEQIGNAVPPPIAMILCQSLIKSFADARPALRAHGEQYDLLKMVDNGASQPIVRKVGAEGKKRGRKTSLSSYYDQISAGKIGDVFRIPITARSEHPSFIVAGLRRRGKKVQVEQDKDTFVVSLVA